MERVEEEKKQKQMKPVCIMNQETGKVAIMSHYLDTFDDSHGQTNLQGQSTNGNSDELLKGSNQEDKSDLIENKEK